jgi:hypothetical protein
MFLLIWIMHGLLLRWRKDGLQKDSSQTVK